MKIGMRRLEDWLIIREEAPCLFWEDGGKEVDVKTLHYSGVNLKTGMGFDLRREYNNGHSFSTSFAVTGPYQGKTVSCIWCDDPFKLDYWEKFKTFVDGIAPAGWEE